MERVDPTAVDSRLHLPDDAILQNGYSFMALSEEQSTDYQRQFNEVMAG